MTGKEKCEFLKGIRKRMAEANGIPYETRECSYEGDCLGTCPICEQEARELLAEIRLKEANGDPIQVDEDAIAMLEDSTVYAEVTDDEKERMRLRHEEELRQLNEPLMGDISCHPDEDMKHEWKQREGDEKRSRHEEIEESGNLAEKELDESTKDDDLPFTINPFKS